MRYSRVIPPKDSGSDIRRLDQPLKTTILIKPNILGIIGYTIFVLMVGVLVGIGVATTYYANRLDKQTNKLTVAVNQYKDQAHYLHERNQEVQTQLLDISGRLRRAEHLMRIPVWERKKQDDKRRADGY